MSGSIEVMLPPSAVCGNRGPPRARPAGSPAPVSGLGHGISRRIVGARLGTIRAENRVAPDGQVEGARFIVELPVDRPGAR
jgi:hypothetical protein